MDLVLKREELLHWLQKVEDSNVLLQIEQIKTKLVRTEKRRYSIDDAKNKTLSKIDQWPGR